MAGEQPTLGFIGLGTMGEPMERLQNDGVEPAESIAQVANTAEIVFLSLPGGTELEEVAVGEGGLASHVRAGQIVVDHTTAPVALARELQETFAETSTDFLDAPVARTRKAAIDGTLAVMVGGDEAVFERIVPYLECMGTNVTYCGVSGNGQTVKLLNNMVLIQTVVAMADALAIGRRAGLDGERLFKVMSDGSADSFALRHHGMLSMVKGEFPEQMFSTEYALKDLTYALELAREYRVDANQAKQAERLLRRTIDEGMGDAYFPVVYEVIEDRGE